MKEDKLEISGQAAAVDEAQTAAENYRQSIVTDQLEITRPGGKVCNLLNS